MNVKRRVERLEARVGAQARNVEVGVEIPWNGSLRQWRADLDRLIAENPDAFRGRVVLPPRVESMAEWNRLVEEVYGRK